MKANRPVGWMALALLIAVGACSSCAGLTTNVAFTSPEAPAEIRTRLYERDIHTLRHLVRSTVGGFERWKIVEEAACCHYEPGRKDAPATWGPWEAGTRPADLGAIHIEITSQLFGFVDDMTVFLTSEDAARTRLDVYSQSRIGKGDLGVNRRNIVGLLAALDRAVAEATPAVRGTDAQRGQ